MILCPAVGLQGLPLEADAERALNEQRLLVLSIFGANVNVASSEQAALRNELVAAMSDLIFVPHAAPHGKAQASARRALERGQEVVTFADGENHRLIQNGAESLTALALASGLGLTHSLPPVGFPGESGAPR